jgi:hypothetical protein
VAQPPHTRLLTAAGRRILRPLGLHQRGRSRLWLDDHGWWLVVVHFEPLNWGEGSFLKVRAMWLWEEKDYFSYDYGQEIEGCIRFEDEAQFAPLADRLAQRAADEVCRLRALFRSVPRRASEPA